MTNKYQYKKLLNFYDLAKNNQKIIKLKSLSLARFNKQVIQITYIPNEDFLAVTVNSDTTKTYYNFKKKKVAKVNFLYFKTKQI